MDKAYKSMDYDSVVSGGEEYQNVRGMKDKQMPDKGRGISEEPFDDFTLNTGAGKKIMDKMKYSPKTVSYSEFTDAKRQAKMQSMIKGGLKDSISKDDMEDMHAATLPSHKSQKSFDIDVTKYSPRKAKG